MKTELEILKRIEALQAENAKLRAFIDEQSYKWDTNKAYLALGAIMRHTRNKIEIQVLEWVLKEVKA
jgi:hypothetical protein